MLFKNYLDQAKTNIKVERKWHTGTRKTDSKSKSKDGQNTNSNKPKELDESARPKLWTWISNILLTCLGAICIILFVEVYLYLRPELFPVSMPTSSIISMSVPTTSMTTPTPIMLMSVPSTVITTTTPEPLVEDYFTSIVKMTKLAHLEQAMIVEMNYVIKTFSAYMDSNSSWRHALTKIKSYLHDYDSSIRPILPDTSTDVGKAVVSHPLVSYRTLRRIVINLPNILLYNVNGILDNLANISALIQPPVTENDIFGAMDGILRLQTTFSISPYDFAHGRFRNFDTKSGLLGADCYLIGYLALHTIKQPSTAIEWIVQALRMYLRNGTVESAEMIPLQMVRSGLQNAIEMHNIEMINQNPWTFGKELQTNLSEMTQENEIELVEALPSLTLIKPPYKLFTEGLTYQDQYNFKGLCGGDKLRNETETKNLKCYYKTDNPFLAIKPLKVEIHSHEPLILQIYDVLSDKIINHFINTTHQGLYEANISNHTKELVQKKLRIASNYRVNDRSDEILIGVSKIIHEVTGLHAMPKTASENAQVFIYGAIGGYYGTHHDTLYEAWTPVNNATDHLNVGDRILTIFFYLTDLKLGGGTAFPKLGVLAEPAKGSAIMWYNLKKNGKLHEQTLHGGCPVLLGEKWIVNKWVRSADQMFVRKCSLDSSE